MNRNVIFAGLGAVVLATLITLLLPTAAAKSIWQGWVEADLLFLGPDEAGRITKLDVTEGQIVAAGAALFRVESDLQDADWRQAKGAVDEAAARLARAEAAQQRPEEIAVLEAQRAQAQAALQQSKPELERAEKLVAQGTSPQTRLDQARAAFSRDSAQLAQVERQIQVARMNARSEDILAAREVLAQANARLQSAETRRRQRTVLAPVAGRIQDVLYRAGEVVPAGRSVVSLLPPGNLKLRFFVAETELPRFAAGARLAVTCDGCATGLTATVTYLSSQAEFTPPVIYSRDERTKLVYRVEARPDDPAKFRVGQPVTVSLTEATIASREGSDGKR
jgi:HlyD family secretion protein